MFKKFLYLLREIIKIPIIFLIEAAYIYAKLIKLLDFRNYSKYLEEKLQNYIDKSKSKKKLEKTNLYHSIVQILLPIIELKLFTQKSLIRLSG